MRINQFVQTQSPSLSFTNAPEAMKVAHLWFMAVKCRIIDCTVVLFCCEVSKTLK